MSSQKIKIEGELLEKAKQCAEASGYASVDEFVLHTLEKEIKRLAPDQTTTRAWLHRVTRLSLRRTGEKLKFRESRVEQRFSAALKALCTRRL
jgi:hypothetical protein